MPPQPTGLPQPDSAPAPTYPTSPVLQALRDRTRRELAEALSLLEPASRHWAAAEVLAGQYLGALHCAAELAEVLTSAQELACRARYERHERQERMSGAASGAWRDRRVLA